MRIFTQNEHLTAAHPSSQWVRTTNQKAVARSPGSPTPTSPRVVQQTKLPKNVTWMQSFFNAWEMCLRKFTEKELPLSFHSFDSDLEATCKHKWEVSKYIHKKKSLELLIYIFLKIAIQFFFSAKSRFLRFFSEWWQVENVAITSTYLENYNDLVFKHVYPRKPYQICSSGSKKENF